MTDANEAIVRRISHNWERGDFTNADFFHPDIEFEMRFGVDHVTARGRTEMGRAWREQLAQWTDWHTGGAAEVLSSGDRVLLQNVISGRGRHSDVVVETSAFAVFTFREGRVVRLELTTDRSEALAAAGIEP